ncbi:heparinase II/III family protein (plasmid) [Agrobacterium vitis]|uniref:heparinase II/III domain-containing protein n=1 Tax=Agrobacterium vitis TaxID=373 RepID=UPI0012E7A41C|nr:heparinase II/III family protein [Agrobacterium vitis]MVA26702.1 heparinase [Agrobacterium vitis]
MFSEHIGSLPPHLADFQPVTGADVHGLRQRLGADHLTALQAAGRAALEADWPQILSSHYRDYTQTGNRSRFEDLYFRRRLMLNDLVLAECAKGKGESGGGDFIDAIIDGVILICEESGWQLPAHNAYGRGGPRQPLPDPDDPVVDLFAAETAANLATLVWLLRPALAKRDPRLPARIEQEIHRRIITPYLTRHFWWMGQGTERMNNWTAWITQNVLIATFSLPTSQEIRRAVLVKALGSLDAFLKDYAEDGACEEGVLYYRHAALCLFGAMTVLDQVAPDLCRPLWQTKKIRNMAEYILNMHVAGRHYFNFADSSAVLEPCSIREYLFGEAVGSKVLMDFASADLRQSADPLLSREWNLWYRLTAATCLPDVAPAPEKLAAKGEIFYPGTGLFIARDSRFDLAVKGGHNGESHNHNDVGSLTLYKDGQPFLIDIGVETYTAKTFSPQRYEIWTMQSAYHNLPAFAGVMQQDGPECAARDVKTAFEVEEARISLEIAAAYPQEAALRSYRRSVRLIRGSHIEVVDEHDGDKPAVLSLITCVAPRAQAGRLILDGLGEISVSGAAEPIIEVIDIGDPRLRQAWPDRIFRILLPFETARLSLTIT